jgi:hypothetical protein
MAADQHDPFERELRRGGLKCQRTKDKCGAEHPRPYRARNDRKQIARHLHVSAQSSAKTISGRVSPPYLAWGRARDRLGAVDHSANPLAAIAQVCSQVLA